jgi:REP element-mobilizing transposase RayT
LKAQGSLSMIHPKRALVVKGIIERAAKRHGVRVERLVNVGNHLHLLISTHSKRAVQARVAFQAFLKEIAGLIARAMSGAKKGSPQGKFWDDLAWSRIVRWGKDLARLKRYFAKNEHDAALVLAGEGWPEWLIHQAMISSVSVRREK